MPLKQYVAPGFFAEAVEGSALRARLKVVKAMAALDADLMAFLVLLFMPSCLVRRSTTGTVCGARKFLTTQWVVVKCGADAQLRVPEIENSLLAGALFLGGLCSRHEDAVWQRKRRSLRGDVSACRSTVNFIAEGLGSTEAFAGFKTLAKMRQ